MLILHIITIIIFILLDKSKNKTIFIYLKNYIYFQVNLFLSFYLNYIVNRYWKKYNFKRSCVCS